MDASFWALVSLLLFFAMLFYLKVPTKVGGALDKQADNIKQELEGARQLREEAQSLLADYQRKRKVAEGEAEQIVEHAKAEAVRIGEQANAAVQDMIERRTKAAEVKIAQAEANAIAEVRAKAADVAAAAAEKLVSASLTDQAKQDEVLKTSISQITGHLN
ncbi:F0F1 ATP synthase subunit B family protein [Flexibacterium corallicola]|uniref:F0F1 ATP synthase subunit B family protein n=1 Tax=Flexibacterium corallicola TaxID=3037259 RepID=UPI00386208CF